MRAAVITFPGSNCDDDAVDTLSRLAGFQTDRVWHKEPASFDGYDLVVLPGGFSYGVYVLLALTVLVVILDIFRLV
jgi:phosphoribosylformylglycinamidine synthase